MLPSRYLFALWVSIVAKTLYKPCECVGSIHHLSERDGSTDDSPGSVKNGETVDVVTNKKVDFSPNQEKPAEGHPESPVDSKTTHKDVHKHDPDSHANPPDAKPEEGAGPKGDGAAEGAEGRPEPGPAPSETKQADVKGHGHAPEEGAGPNDEDHDDDEHLDHDDHDFGFDLHVSEEVNGGPKSGASEHAPEAPAASDNGTGSAPGSDTQPSSVNGPGDAPPGHGKTEDNAETTGAGPSPEAKNEPEPAHNQTEPAPNTPETPNNGPEGVTNGPEPAQKEPESEQNVQAHNPAADNQPSEPSPAEEPAVNPGPENHPGDAHNVHDHSHHEPLDRAEHGEEKEEHKGGEEKECTCEAKNTTEGSPIKLHEPAANQNVAPAHNAPETPNAPSAPGVAVPGVNQGGSEQAGQVEFQELPPQIDLNNLTDDQKTAIHDFYTKADGDCSVDCSHSCKSKLGGETQCVSQVSSGLMCSTFSDAHSLTCPEGHSPCVQPNVTQLRSYTLKSGDQDLGSLEVDGSNFNKCMALALAPANGKCDKEDFVQNLLFTAGALNKDYIIQVSADKLTFSNLKMKDGEYKVCLFHRHEGEAHIGTIAAIIKRLLDFINPTHQGEEQPRTVFVMEVGNLKVSD